MHCSQRLQVLQDGLTRGFRLGYGRLIGYGRERWWWHQEFPVAFIMYARQLKSGHYSGVD